MCHAGPTVCNLFADLASKRSEVPWHQRRVFFPAEGPVRNTGSVRAIFSWASRRSPPGGPLLPYFH